MSEKICFCFTLITLLARGKTLLNAASHRIMSVSPPSSHQEEASRCCDLVEMAVKKSDWINSLQSGPITLKKKSFNLGASLSQRFLRPLTSTDVKHSTVQKFFGRHEEIL